MSNLEDTVTITEIVKELWGDKLLEDTTNFIDLFNDEIAPFLYNLIDFEYLLSFQQEVEVFDTVKVDPLLKLRFDYNQYVLYRDDFFKEGVSSFWEEFPSETDDIPSKLVDYLSELLLHSSVGYDNELLDIQFIVKELYDGK